MLLKGHEITWKLNYEKAWDDSRAGGHLPQIFTPINMEKNLFT